MVPVALRADAGRDRRRARRRRAGGSRRRRDWVCHRCGAGGGCARFAFRRPDGRPASPDAIRLTTRSEHSSRRTASRVTKAPVRDGDSGAPAGVGEARGGQRGNVLVTLGPAGRQAAGLRRAHGRSGLRDHGHHRRRPRRRARARRHVPVALRGASRARAHGARARCRRSWRRAAATRRQRPRSPTLEALTLYFGTDAAEETRRWALRAGQSVDRPQDASCRSGPTARPDARWTIATDRPRCCWRSRRSIRRSSRAASRLPGRSRKRRGSWAPRSSRRR